MDRINRLEEENELQEAIISKLQTDAAQAIGKDKLIIELESQLSDALELIKALEAGQRTLLKRYKEAAGKL